MTHELAQKILDAFGPCTVLGEFFTVSDVVKGTIQWEWLSRSEDPDTTEEQAIKDWIDSRLTIEDIVADRRLGTSARRDGYAEIPERAVTEWRERRGRIVRNLKALGYDFT